MIIFGACICDRIKMKKNNSCKKLSNYAVVQETVENLDSFLYRLHSEYVKKKTNLKADISEWMPNNIFSAKTDFSDTNVRREC